MSPNLQVPCKFPFKNFIMIQRILTKLDAIVKIIEYLIIYFVGLHLTLNIDQDMYLESMGEEAGVRVLVHHQSSMPFPEDEGVLVLPGQVASIGLRKVSITGR